MQELCLLEYPLFFKLQVFCVAKYRFLILNITLLPLSQVTVLLISKLQIFSFHEIRTELLVLQITVLLIFKNTVLLVSQIIFFFSFANYSFSHCQYIVFLALQNTVFSLDKIQLSLFHKIQFYWFANYSFYSVAEYSFARFAN